MEIQDDRSHLDEMLQQLAEMDQHSLEIGIFGSDDSFFAMIANVHEFGMTIKPKNGKNLAIPVHRKAVGKSPHDFGDELQPMFTKKGGKSRVYGLGVKTGTKGEMEMYFVLKESVNIPERSFIRSTFDEKNDEWMEYLEGLVQKLCDLELSAKMVFDRLGSRIAEDIQDKMTDLRSPKNSALTVQNKGSSNPLIDTGGLRRRVTWKVVSKR